mgnify:FL=1
MTKISKCLRKDSPYPPDYAIMKRALENHSDEEDQGNSKRPSIKSEVVLTLHRKVGEGTYGKVYQARFSRC